MVSREMLSPLRSLGHKAIINSGVKSRTSPTTAEVPDKGPVAIKSELLSAVGWSTLAFLGFGVQNFIIGYTNELPGEDFKRTIGLLWFGTGLCGLLLEPFARQLTGVDLSEGMLRKAATGSRGFDRSAPGTRIQTPSIPTTWLHKGCCLTSGSERASPPLARVVCPSMPSCSIPNFRN